MYAHFEANKYTIYFNSNGGNAPNPAIKIVTYDSTYDTLAGVSREGYTFNGWFTAASGGTKIETSTKVNITSDQTLYAHWTVNSYTVSIIPSAGGSVNNNLLVINYGETNKFTATPNSGYYLESITCTNGYTVSDYSTGTSATGTQTVTVRNNSKTNNTTCNVSFKILCPYTIGAPMTFNYTGEVQSFEAKCSGIYKLELWGASGGTAYGYGYSDKVLKESQVKGGNGGYASGYKQLSLGTTLYMCIGGAGSNASTSESTALGGYNGGAKGTQSDHKDHVSYETHHVHNAGGGGATHIATTNRGELYNYESYTSEILIVAGAGSGGQDSYEPEENGEDDEISGTPGKNGGLELNGDTRFGKAYSDRGGGGYYTKGHANGTNYIGNIPEFTINGIKYSPISSTSSHRGNGVIIITYLGN